MSDENLLSPALEQNSNGIYVESLYRNWFLEYSSYVVLERAIPQLEDGLKPVQRRLMHALKEMDDGRYHKVANVIGQTMQYHPHGDAAIGDALVHIGQKGVLIDPQGNWGEPRTGDPAAASRYIEARLSPFAREVVFNSEITPWQWSYDGRKKEPVSLPVKFPLLLVQGVEGIAVGLATKIMPHNFCELIDASIAVLRGKETQILPDFPSGGMADFSQYSSGQKGGKIRVRANIEIVDKKMLVIRDLPYTATTTSLIESIVKANDSGKIKIKQVIDNTAKDVEIVVELPPGVSPEVTVDALYAFSDCEVSISPNSCVIIDDKPHFIGVDEILQRSTQNTVGLLQRELEIKLEGLQRRWHALTLEKIFIENRLYRNIEQCQTWEDVLATIAHSLKPFLQKLRAEVSEEDIVRLTEIKIRRISRYNAEAADKTIATIETEMEQLSHHLAHIIQYAIDYFTKLKDKYGQGRERKTKIATFDTIEVTQVAMANQKLYVNRKDGFIGYGLKKDELVGECSDIDDIIVFFKSGSCKVTRISDKAFVGKDIIHVAVWKKNDERMIYHLVYRDGDSGKSFAKRFAITAITRDKEYDLTKGSKGSKILYFSANPNGETEIVDVQLSNRCNARNKRFEFDFATLAIKGRGAQGNILSKYPVSRIAQKSVGASTFGGVDIWYDDAVGRLNTEERGDYLGNFDGDDLVLAIYKDGSYELTSFELTNRYDSEELASIEKFAAETTISVVHYDGEKRHHFVKRFQVETKKTDTRYRFIGEHRDSRLLLISSEAQPHILLTYEKKRPRQRVEETIDISEHVAVKGWKSIGNRLCFHQVIDVALTQAPPQKGQNPQEMEEVEQAEDEKAQKIEPEEEEGLDWQSMFWQ